MSWVAVGTTVVAAGASAYSSRQARNASQGGTDASISEQARQYDITRRDFAPGRSLGNSAMDAIARLYGFAAPSQAAAREEAAAPVKMGNAELPAGTTAINLGGGRYDVLLNGQRIGGLRRGGPNGIFEAAPGVDINGLFAQQRAQTQTQEVAAAPTGPDMSGFFTSPDYQFNLDQGQQAIDRSLAARGRSLSGAGVKEGQRYASGLASGEFGNYVNRLFTAAGLGNAATTSTAAAGQNMANNNSAAILSNANNRASLYMQNGANINNAAQSGVSNYMLQQYLRNQPKTGVIHG